MKSKDLIIAIILSTVIQLSFSYFLPEKFGPDAANYNYTATIFAKSNALVESGFRVNSDGTIGYEDQPFSEGGIGYPLFMGIIYKLFGPDHGAAVTLMIQALLIGILIPSCVFLILSSILHASPLMTRAGLIMTVLWPTAPELSRDLLTEGIATVAFIIFMYSLFSIFYSKQKTSVKQLVVLGLSGSVLFLVRYEFAGFIVLALILTSIRSRYYKIGDLKNITLVSLFMLAVMIIPTIRNYTIFHRFIPLSTSGGKVLYLGAICSGNFGFMGERTDIFRQAYVPGDADLTNENLRKIAVTEIKKDPLKYLSCSLKRFVSNLAIAYSEPSWNDSAPFEKLIKIYKRIFKLFIVFGFLLAIPTMIRKNIWIAAAVLFIFAFKFMFIHVFMVGDPRFFTVFEPLAIVLTSFQLGQILATKQKYGSWHFL